MQPKILFIGRGLPSGGHVSTCWAISQALTQKLLCSTRFVSYGAGGAFLKFLGAACLELPSPTAAVFTHRTFPGWDMFELQDHLAPFCDDFQPDLVVCDGELYVPQFCQMRGIPCISIASPNYISLDSPPYSEYAGLIAHLLNKSSLVLGYGAAECRPSALLDASRLQMISPPMKYDRTELSSQAVREKYGFGQEDQIVLVYCGAGNISTPEFLAESQKIIDVPVTIYLEHLQYRYPRMKLVLVSGTSVNVLPHKNIRFESYVDFMQVANASNLVIARSGRNVMYEMAYLGVPSILIGINSKTDLQRNCEIAEQWKIAWPLQSTDLTPVSLLPLVERAMIPENAQKIARNGRAFVPENGIQRAVDKILEFIQLKK